MAFAGYAFELTYHSEPLTSDHLSVSADRMFYDKRGNARQAILRKPTDASTLLKKINSNIEYKPFKSNLKSGEPHYYSKEYKAYYQSAFAYLQDNFKGAEYKIPDNYIAKDYLPLHGAKVELTQGTKDYLYDLAYRYYHTKQGLLNRGNYNDLYYTSVADQLADYQRALQDFVLAFARSNLRAGISAEQTLQDMIDNMYLEGIDEGSFIEAYKGEQRKEVARGTYEDSVVTDCCLDYEENYLFRKSSDDFSTYQTRVYEFSSFKGLLSFFGLY